MLKLKRQWLWCLVLLVCLAASGFAGAAVAAPAPEDGGEKVSLAAGLESAYAPDELLVKVKSGVGAEDESALHSRAGAVAVDKNKVLGLTKVKLAAGTDMKRAMAEYRSSAAVEYVQPNYVYHALLVPNDPHYWRQWNMPKISAEPAWDINRGDAGVIVAVVDTGVDLDHPDLAGNVVSGYNFINPGGPPQDDHGHGTHVAGIVAAVTDNGVGVAGAAALVQSLRPDYTNDQVENALKAGCVDLGGPGWDPYYGCGRLDVLAALEGALPVGGGTIRGQVYLEGRSNWSGAVVNVAGATYTAVTAADGTFVLAGLPPGIYDLRTGKESYLSRVCHGVEVIEGSVTDVYSPLILLAGDFSLDNKVDIDDLLVIRNAYGTTPGDDWWSPLVDVNQDGKIGIIDLVYMASNYAKYGQ